MLEFLGRMKGLDESATSPEPLEVLNQVPSETSATGKGTVKRKYHDSYLDIWFVETSDNKPHCVICGKFLINSNTGTSCTATFIVYICGLHVVVPDVPVL